ncbi:MAG: DUF6089 family protein [Bacteroidota bacterium]
MRRFILLLICGLTINLTSVLAQPNRSYFAVSLSGGVMNYTGDLVVTEQIINFSRPAFSIGAFYKFDPFLGARLEVTHGSIAADDGKSNNDGLRLRNLSFRSPITALDAQLIFDFIPTDGPYYRRPLLTPYVFAGISVFAFNPKAELNGDLIDLKPLGTEGQFLTDPDNRYPDPYSLVQIAIPLGVGIRYRIGQNWDISAEAGFRKTYTDYLDDASTFYPNMAELLAQNPTAFVLSDRTNLALSPDGTKLSENPNAIRANSSTDDGWWTTKITVSYILDFVRCP